MAGNINKKINSKETAIVRSGVRLPAKQGYRVSEYTKPVTFITEAEVYRLADIAGAMRDGERNELLILTMFQAALRVTEAVKLRLMDKATVDGRHILMVQGKGNKPRLVAIPQRLSHHLGDYAQRRGLKAEDRLFPISRVRAWQIIKKCSERASINRRVYCHLLRHGGAIARLKRTGNPKSLQIHLGHADMKMTMRYLATMQLAESLEIESGVQFDR
jgi:integrase/recombinase XerD